MVEEFLGRDAEQDQFRLVLRSAILSSDGPDSGFLVLVHGPGGIGKTTLLDRFKRIATGASPIKADGEFRGAVLVAGIDCDAERESSKNAEDYRRTDGPPLWRVLNGLHSALEHALTGREREILVKAMTRFRSLMTRLQGGDEQRPQPQGNLASKIGTGVGIGIASAAGVFGVPVSPEGTGQAINSLARAVQERVRRKRDAAVSNEEYEEIFDPDAALARTFGEGLKALSQECKRPVLLTIDTAEILGQAHEGIRDTIRHSGRRAVWVMAMRLDDGLDADQSLLDATRRSVDGARLRRIPISGFDDNILARYLTAALGDPLPAGVSTDAVARLTRGVPLAVKFVVEMLLNGVPPAEALSEVSATGDVSSMVIKLANRYLVHAQRQEPRGDLDLIYGLAVMHPDGARDVELLAAIWGTDPGSVPAAAEGLSRRHDFVRLRDFSLHQDVRSAIRLFLLDQTRRPVVNAANGRAIVHLRQRLVEVGATTVQKQLDSNEWCSVAVQLLWHTLWRDERQGLRLLAHLLPAAYAMRPGFASSLLRTTDLFMPLAPEEQRLLLAGLRTIVPASDFLRRVHELFRKSPSRGHEVEAVYLRRAVTLLEESCQLTEPVLATDVPLSVFLDLLRLGYPEPFDEDVVTLAAALERIDAVSPVESTPKKINQSIASRAAGLAQKLMRNSNGDITPSRSGLRALRIAIARDGSKADYWGMLSAALMVSGEVDAAEEAMEQAVQRGPNDVDLWEAFAAIQSRAGRHEAALETLTEAIRRFPNAPKLLTSRARTLQELQRAGDALPDLQMAVQVDPANLSRRADLAAAYAARGEYEAALAEFFAAAELEPDNAYIRANIGLTLRNLERHAEAVAEFAKACDLNPKSARLRLDYARALQRVDRGTEALAQIDAARALAPNDAAIYAERGKLLLEMGQRDEALAAFEAAYERQRNGDRYAALADLLVKMGRAEEALARLDDLLANDPDNPLNYLNKAVLLGMTGRPEEALRASRASYRLAPDSPRYRDAHAAHLAAHGDASNLPEIAELIQAHPEAPSLRMAEMTLLARADRIDELLSAYLRAISRIPDNAAIHQTAGRLLTDARRFEHALAAYREATRLDPGSASSLSVMAWLHGTMGNNQEALATYERALVLEPDASALHAGRGWILGQVGRFEEAMAAYERAIELGSRDVVVHANRALALERVGLDQQALAAIEGSLTLFPGDPRLRASRAMALARLRRYDQSIPELTALVNEQPGAIDPLANRAMVYWAVGWAEQSLADLESALAIDPQRRDLLCNSAMILVDNNRIAEARSRLLTLLAAPDAEFIEARVYLAAIDLHTRPADALNLCRTALVAHGADVSRFRRAEMRALAHLMLGAVESALGELRAAVPYRNGLDRFEPGLYGLLNGVPGVTSIIDIWRTLR